MKLSATAVRAVLIRVTVQRVRRRGGVNECARLRRWRRRRWQIVVRALLQQRVLIDARSSLAPRLHRALSTSQRITTPRVSERAGVDVMAPYRARAEFRGATVATYSAMCEVDSSKDDNVIFTCRFNFSGIDPRVTRVAPLPREGVCTVFLQNSRTLTYTMQFPYVLPGPHMDINGFSTCDLPHRVDLVQKQTATSTPTPLCNSSLDAVRQTRQVGIACARLFCELVEPCEHCKTTNSKVSHVAERHSEAVYWMKELRLYIHPISLNYLDASRVI